MTTEKTPQAERENTDGSLRRERNRTDHALAAKRRLTQDMADGVVERAREQADEVLDTAREKADEKLNPGRSAAETQVAVTQERFEEDEALKQERATADDNLRWERDEQARILAALLPREREKTDRYLLTERTRSDEAVAHRDDFMGMVSHDLRDLLSGIAMISKVVAMQASDSDEGNRTVARMDRIESYVARMNRLIGDLVDVAGIDSGKLAVYPDDGDIAELISEAITPFFTVAEEKGLALEATTEDPSLPAFFDRDRMLQVLTNLIANAMRFTPAGGRITIAAARAGDELRVSVLDTGKGIAEEMREAIFERFSQVGGNDHGGLGLGLHISKCIVEAQGGRIWAESNPAGTGSAFHLTVPTDRSEREVLV